MRTVLLLGQDGMGTGDAELGQRVLATFLRKAQSIRGLSAVLFFNSGVRLVAEGSPVLMELQLLHDNGVDLLPCATCIDHFGVRDRIRAGSISTMDDLIIEMDRADKLIRL